MAMRITAQHRDTAYLAVRAPSGEDVPNVVWYDTDTGRYATLHTTPYEERGQRWESADGEVEIVRDPDGTLLIDTRTGAAYEPEGEP
jgi:hypothetical protein